MLTFQTCPGGTSLSALGDVLGILTAELRIYLKSQCHVCNTVEFLYINEIGILLLTGKSDLLRNEILDS